MDNVYKVLKPNVPISFVNVFIGPYFRMKDSNTALATVFAFLFGIGMPSKYFVRSHMRICSHSFITIFQFW